MSLNQQSPMSSTSFYKSPLSPGSSIPCGSPSTAGSSLYSPLGSPCSLLSHNVGVKLPEIPSNPYVIWQHATYLFHQRRYASALLALQYLVLQPRIPSAILRRLYVNIGLVQLALHDPSSASTSFQDAFTARDFTNTDFITSPSFEGHNNISHVDSTSTSLTALAGFLQGIAAWELGYVEKAQTFFDCCVMLFSDISEPASEAFERCTRYFSFRPLGLAYILDVGQPRRNSKFCAERMKLEKRFHMKAAWTWEMHRLPEDVIFEADRAIMEEDVDGAESFVRDHTVIAEQEVEDEPREVENSTADNIHSHSSDTEMVQIKIDGNVKPIIFTTTTLTLPASKDHIPDNLTRLGRKTVTFSKIVDVIQDNDNVDATQASRRSTVPRRSSLRLRRRRPPDAQPFQPLPVFAEVEAVKAAEIEVWLEAL